MGPPRRGRFSSARRKNGRAGAGPARARAASACKQTAATPTHTFKVLGTCVEPVCCARDLILLNSFQRFLSHALLITPWLVTKVAFLAYLGVRAAAKGTCRCIEAGAHAARVLRAERSSNERSSQVDAPVRTSALCSRDRVRTSWHRSGRKWECWVLSSSHAHPPWRELRPEDSRRYIHRCCESPQSREQVLMGGPQLMFL